MVRALGALVLFSLLLALVYRFDNKYTAGPPYGEGGVFSFTQADLDRPLLLIDGWLLDGEETFIGQYSNFSYLPGRSSPFGSAAYELTLRYDGPPRALVLELPPIFTEYVLTVNGLPAAQTGSGTSVAVPVGGGDTRLRLDVVNRSHYYSGLTYPPALGTAAVMGRLFFTRTALYAAVCAAALTLALFSLALWLSRERDGLFLHFGVLCLAFAVHCLHPFFWQWGLTGEVWYALADGAWLLTLAQGVALAAVSVGARQAPWYRCLVRPITLGLAALAFFAVCLIIPNAPGFVNFYGGLQDWYKLCAWALLAVCAGRGLARREPGTGPVLCACAVLGVSLAADWADSGVFEPIRGLWQEEYAGAALVLAFGALMVRRNAELLRQSAELRSVKLQNRFAAESAAQMRASIGQVRALKHELRHHVETMQALHAAGDHARLGDYLARLAGEKEALPQLYYAENFLVNAILAGRLGPAQEAGVRVICAAGVPERLPIADADLCTLLSNLLDNAVEACARLPEGAERFIQVSLEARQDLLVIRCSNSAPPRGEGAEFPTTKPDPDSHGLGLPAMRRVVERYDGALEASQTGGVFTLRAVLRIPEA